MKSDSPVTAQKNIRPFTIRCRTRRLEATRYSE